MSKNIKRILIGIIVGMCLMFAMIMFLVLRKKEDTKIEAYTINTESACNKHGYYWDCLYDGSVEYDCSCYSSRQSNVINFGY